MRVVLPLDYPYSPPVLRICNKDGRPSDQPYTPEQEWSAYSSVSELLEQLRGCISVLEIPLN